MFGTNQLNQSHWTQRVSLASVVALLALGLALPAAEAEAQGQSQGKGKGLAKGKGLKGLVDLGEPHFSPARTPAHEDIPKGGIGRNFRLLDHNPLIQTGGTLPRGGGGNEIAIIRNCAYAATKNNDQGLMILDISDPRNMRVVREMEPLPNAPSGNSVTSDHLIAVESENLLVQFSENNSAPWDGNFAELFDTTDCFNPVKVGHIDLPDTPHDPNMLWQGGNPHRVLMFLTFNNRRGMANPPPPADVDLRIYDITVKSNPIGPIAEYSFQRVFQIPVRETPPFFEYAGFNRRNAIHAINVSNDHLSSQGFPTRIYTATYGIGWPILDSTPLAERLAGGPACDVDSAGPNPCIKKLNPLLRQGNMSKEPPFNQSSHHSAVKVPNRPYMMVSDEPGQCPWSWLRFAYIGDEEDGVEVSGQKLRGDIFPGQVGSFRIPENREEECAENRAKFAHDVSGDESFNAHLHLVFENIMFTSWNNAGLRAIDISDPGMPFEAGFYFPPPVPGGVTAAGDDHPNLSLNSVPTLKDGVIYVMDRVNGVYSFEYTGPRSDEVPKEGLFTQQQTQVVGRQP
jgi:hypothetical protein